MNKKIALNPIIEGYRKLRSGYTMEIAYHQNAIDKLKAMIKMCDKQISKEDEKDEN